MRPLLLLLLLLSACKPTPTVEQARDFYASQAPYLRPRPPSAVPEGLPDMKASTCGACHTEIYAEWKLSTHARAWADDAQFQAELHKSTQPDSDAGWMCVNCHTPVEGQLPKLVVDLKDGRLDAPEYVQNPGYDPAFQLEAITCATCHVAEGVVLGPWGDSNAPHPVKKSEALLGVEVCTSCHQARAEFPSINLACTFDTGAEHAASPYAAEGKSCPACHMPEVERPAALGAAPRTTRRHWFGGSLIPKAPEFEAELAPLRAIYPDGMTLDWVDPPAPTPGQELAVELEYRNAEAGHLLPTGDPERFILVEAWAVGPDGTELAREQVRIGTKYEWWPKVRKLEDNRLKPGEARRLALRFPAPEGPVTLHFEASKWRISEENLKYHDLEGKVVPGRVFATGERVLGAAP